MESRRTQALNLPSQRKERTVSRGSDLLSIMSQLDESELDNCMQQLTERTDPRHDSRKPPLRTLAKRPRDSSGEREACALKKKARLKAKRRPELQKNGQRSGGKEFGGLKNTFESFSNRMKYGATTRREESSLNGLYAERTESLTSENLLPRVTTSLLIDKPDKVFCTFSSYVEAARDARDGGPPDRSAHSFIKSGSGPVPPAATERGADRARPPRSSVSQVQQKSLESLETDRPAASPKKNNLWTAAGSSPTNQKRATLSKLRLNETHIKVFDFEFDSPHKSKATNTSPEAKLNKRKRLQLVSDDYQRSASKSSSKCLFKLSIVQARDKKPMPIQTRTSRSVSARFQAVSPASVALVAGSPDADSKKSPTAKQIKIPKKLATPSHHQSSHRHFKTLKDVLLNCTPRK